MSSVVDYSVVSVETEDSAFGAVRSEAVSTMSSIGSQGETGSTLSLDKGRLMIAMIPESAGASGRTVDTDAHIG